MDLELKHLGQTLALGGCAMFSLFLLLRTFKMEGFFELLLKKREDMKFLEGCFFLALVFAMGIVIEDASKGVVTRRDAPALNRGAQFTQSSRFESRYKPPLPPPRYPLVATTPSATPSATPSTTSLPAARQLHERSLKRLHPDEVPIHDAPWPIKGLNLILDTDSELRFKSVFTVEDYKQDYLKCRPKKIIKEILSISRDREPYVIELQKILGYPAIDAFEISGNTRSIDHLTSTVGSIYYIAKNRVYREPTYRTELAELNDRCDFTRSLTLMLFTFSLIYILLLCHLGLYHAVISFVERYRHRRRVSMPLLMDAPSNGKSGTICVKSNSAQENSSKAADKISPQFSDAMKALNDFLHIEIVPKQEIIHSMMMKLRGWLLSGTQFSLMFVGRISLRVAQQTKQSLARIILITMIYIIGTMAVRSAYRSDTESYNLRVFGYYVSLHTEPSNTSVSKP